MLALINARLVDGTGGEPLERANILVEGNRIAGVGPETVDTKEYTTDDKDGKILVNRLGKSR